MCWGNVECIKQNFAILFNILANSVHFLQYFVCNLGWEYNRVYVCQQLSTSVSTQALLCCATGMQHILSNPLLLYCGVLISQIKGTFKWRPSGGGSTVYNRTSCLGLLWHLESCFRNVPYHTSSCPEPWHHLRQCGVCKIPHFKMIKKFAMMQLHVLGPVNVKTVNKHDYGLKY